MKQLAFRLLFRISYIHHGEYMIYLPSALRRVLLASALAVTASLSASAQYFPSFGPSTAQTQISMDQGISSAQVPNEASPNPLMAVYSNQGVVNYALLADGLHVNTSQSVPYLPGVDCALLSTCSVSIYYYSFQNLIVLAYADSGTAHGLDVAIATPAPGGAYTFNLVHQDNTVSLTTSPAMYVFNNQLHIVFGSSTDPNTHNAFFDVTYNGNSFTEASEANLGGSADRISSPVQPGFAVLGGSVYLCSQQNNYNSNNRNLIVYKSTDGITWTFIHQDTLDPAQGISLIENNGNLILATAQNNSNKALFVFSSPDGINWSAEEYQNILLGATPSLTLFNGEYSLVYKNRNTSTAPTYLWTNLAAY